MVKLDRGKWRGELSEDQLPMWASSAVTCMPEGNAEESAGLVEGRRRGAAAQRKTVSESAPPRLCDGARDRFELPRLFWPRGPISGKKDSGIPRMNAISGLAIPQIHDALQRNTCQGEFMLEDAAGEGEEWAMVASCCCEPALVEEFLRTSCGEAGQSRCRCGERNLGRWRGNRGRPAKNS